MVECWTGYAVAAGWAVASFWAVMWWRERKAYHRVMDLLLTVKSVQRVKGEQRWT